MTHAFYGKVAQHTAADPVEVHLEEIRTLGYTILHGLFSEAELAQWRARIDATYACQEKDFGRDALIDIQEVDICRAPLLYDFTFATHMAQHPKIMDIVQRLLGEWAILNLQNVTLNRPGVKHHQSHWHRDLPHQNFVISQPIAINALIAIDPFTSETGGTQFLPYSHRSENLPSDAYIDQHLLKSELPAGSAIMFDAMMFHRAGSNSSPATRRAVNHLYTAPIIKQQYDFPRALGTSQKMSPALARLLGFDSQVPLDDKAWRESRRARQKRKTA